MDKYITLTKDNIEMEHVCCAISDKKHQKGVVNKKAWIKDQIEYGHTFTKLDAKGKVFIEYTPLEKAWVPIIGNNYYYIHCLWVSGSFKHKGHADNLLTTTIKRARDENKDGVCILSSKKKKPFLSDYKFLLKYDFKIVDEIDDYLLLAINFNSNKPQFSPSVKKRTSFNESGLRIYYSPQCPYSINCIEQVENYCIKNDINLKIIKVTNLEDAKNLPSVFNNWAVFIDGKFNSIHLLNETYLKKVLISN
ncbi:MAG: YoaP domain-containing protein [Sphaerochaetaceae bacterium]|nr:YoaP domain-containing protein [Sphaerochaetaceae bacterium]